MRAFIFTYFLTSFACSIYAQQIPKNPNKIDKNNLRQGNWTLLYDESWNAVEDANDAVYYRLLRYKDDLPVGRVKDYYLSGVIQWEGQLLADRPNDVMEGECIWYDEEGNKSTVRLYENGQLINETLYNPDGTEDNFDSDFTLALDYYQEEKYEEALVLFEKYLSQIVELVQDDTELFKDFLVMLSTCYEKTNQPEKAEEIYPYIEQLTAQLESDEPQIDEEESLVDKSLRLYRAGRYQEAIPVFEEVAEQILNQFGVGENYVIILVLLGKAHRFNGDYESALEVTQQALSIQKDISGENDAEYGIALKNLAELYHDMGNYPQSEALYLESLDIMKLSYDDTDIEVGYILSAMGVLYKDMAAYEKAEQLYLQALEIKKDHLGENDDSYAQTLHNLAALYKTIGDYSKAESSYLQAIEIYKNTKGEMHPTYAEMLNSLGLLYYDIGKYDQVTTLLVQALDIKEAVLGENHPSYARALHNVAWIYYELSEYENAVELYLQALEIKKKTLGEMHPSYTISLNALASVYKTMRDYEQAGIFYKKALEIRKISLGEGHADYAISLNNLALYYFDLGQYQQAAPLFLEAIQNKKRQIEALLPILSESQRKNYVASIQVFFENFYAFALEYAPENPEIVGDLMDLQLTLKGLIFSSSQKIQQQILNSGAEDLIERFQNWKAKRALLAEVTQMSITEKENSNFDEEVLKAETETLERELSVSASNLSDFQNLTTSTQLTWQDFQKNLKKDEAIIEIIRISIPGQVTDDVTYAVLMITSETKKQPELLILENGEELEDKFLTYYQNQIRGKRRDKLSYDNYWQAIQSKLNTFGDINRIYLSRDGAYHQINLNTLYNTKTQKYLAEEKEIILVNSWQNFIAQKKQANDTQSSTNGYVLLGYADYDNASKEAKQLTEYSTFIPDTIQNQVRNYFEGQKINILTGTKTEVENIANLLKEQDKDVAVYQSENASENLIKSLNSPKILHIATHGFFIANIPDPENQDLNLSEREKAIRLDENPLLRSGLILAGASNPQVKETTGEDGILTAEEAMNLYLDNTELVVMSACETGKGEIANGEGVYGLQRAFQQAGAKNILMSLWKVDDTATQKLMTYFYGAYLRNGENIREAFQVAQTKLKEEYPEPYYWGAFVLIGE